MYQPPTWGRRRVLRGVAVVGSLAVAGCAGGGGNDAMPEPTTQPTTTPAPTTTEDDAVQEDVVLAAEDFARAGDVFLDRVDGLEATFDFVDLEAGPMREDVAVGVKTLEAVEGASDDPPPVVDVLRTVGEWLALLADALEAYAEGLDVLATAAVFVRNDRYADAVDELEPSGASFRSVGSHLEAAAEGYPAIEVEPIARLEDSDPEAVRDQLEEVRGGADDLGGYAATMAHYVAGLTDHERGRERYDAGSSAADDDRYDDAAGAFEDAIGSFEGAREDAVAGEAAAPTPLLEEVVRLTCSAAHRRAAAEHFLTAVTEADRGDTDEAQAAYDEAMAEEDEADAC